MNERSTDDAYRCCGCGKTYIEGKYPDCDCITGTAFRRSNPRDIIVAQPRCAWCKAYPVRAEIDGEHLCQSCCEKWVKGEAS